GGGEERGERGGGGEGLGLLLRTGQPRGHAARQHFRQQRLEPADRRRRGPADVLLPVAVQRPDDLPLAAQDRGGDHGVHGTQAPRGGRNHGWSLPEGAPLPEEVVQDVLTWWPDRAGSPRC